MRYVTLIKLSDEGRKRYGEAPKLFTDAVKITESLGGKLFDTYAISGKYDFCTIVEYPSPEIAFEARLKLLKMGIFQVLESYEAFDMDLFLKKV